MSNLLEKASIIQVPAGYNVGSINAVKPNDEVSDTELITNGDFATDSDWVKGGGWSIADGKATSDGGGGSATLRTPTLSISNGNNYQVEFEVTDFTSGGFKVYLGDNGEDDSLVVDNVNSVGTYSFKHRVTNSSNNYLVFRNAGSLGTPLFSIDNVSVKQVTSADLYFDRGTSATQTRNASDGDIESVGMDIPRIDYQGGVGHWLIEPETTNFSTYSSDFSQGRIFNSTSGDASLTNATLSTPTINSPDGTANATKITATNIGGTGGVNINFFNVDLDFTLNSTLSIFAKKDTKDILAFDFIGYPTMNGEIYFNLTNGTVGTSTATFENSSIEDYGDGWYRCSVTLEEQPVDRRGTVRIHVCNADGSVQCDRDGVSSLFIWGIQSEISSRTFPTSYIPTSGSTVTRDTEVASGSGDSTMFNDSEGVLYFETASLISLDSDFRTISISDGTNDETLRIRYSTTANRIDVLTRSGASTKIDMNYTVTDVTDFHKIALKYKSGDSALWVDGVERATSTVTFTHSGLNELKLSQGDANAPFYGKIKCIAVFKEALSDTELQCLTS